MNQQPKQKISFLPKSKKEIANDYEISTDTVRRWCEKIGINTNSKLTVAEVKKFYHHYGIPEKEVFI